METNIYGSELSAARVATEIIIELRYHLRMIGVPLDDSAMLLGDNMSAVINTTLSSSVVKKKANAISYHKIRENIAGRIMKFAFVRSKTNLSDIFTKALDKPLFFPIVEKYLSRKPGHIEELRKLKMDFMVLIILWSSYEYF